MQGGVVMATAALPAGLQAVVSPRVVAGEDGMVAAENVAEESAEEARRLDLDPCLSGEGGQVPARAPCCLS